MFFRKKYSICEVTINPLNTESVTALEKHCSKVSVPKVPISISNLVQGGTTLMAISSKEIKKIQNSKDSPLKILTVLEEGLTEKEVIKKLMG